MDVCVCVIVHTYALFPIWSKTTKAKQLNLVFFCFCQCDGASLDLANGPRLEGIALLNIPSIYGGTNLWGENPSQKKRRKAQKAKKDKDKEFSTSSMSSAELAIAVQGERMLLILLKIIGHMLINPDMLREASILLCMCAHMHPSSSYVTFISSFLFLHCSESAGGCPYILYMCMAFWANILHLTGVALCGSLS